jgi:hypothetical protein
LVLRIPDRRGFRRLLLAAEADVDRGDVQVYRGRPDCRLAHRFAMRWSNSRVSSSEEQVLEFLPESRLLTRVNDHPVARPGTVRGTQAHPVRLCAELEGFAAGQVHWDKRMTRIFLGELAVCAFVCTFWGVGCGDFFHPAGEQLALGPWGPFLFVALGLAVVVGLVVRHRKDKSEVRQSLPLLVAIMAIVAGWHARDRVAAELWNLRCSSDWRGITYCRTSAQKFGFFTTKIGNTDILGRICIGDEWPFVLCRYFPRFDPPRCKRVADECAEIRRTTLRQYACVEQICEEWQWRCQFGPIDDASPVLREKLRRSHGAP